LLPAIEGRVDSPIEGKDAPRHKRIAPHHYFPNSLLIFRHFIYNFRRSIIFLFEVFGEERQVRRFFRIEILVVLLVLCAGCVSVETFPERPVRIVRDGAEDILEYDTDGNGRVDFMEKAVADGRVLAIDKLPSSKSPGWEAKLDEADPRKCRHIIFLLDGIPYDLVRELYGKGFFRTFYPPQKIITVFPSMTDLSYSTLFHAGSPAGIQSLYFDPHTNKMSSGSSTYLKKSNKLGFDYMDYHTESYIGSTAGVGTIDGRDGIIRYLARFDRLAHQLLMEYKGEIKITVLADHGHTLMPAKDARLAKHLESYGFRISRNIKKDEDVVLIQFGLVTNASVYTRVPGRVAEALLEHPGVNLCIYPEDEAVVVKSRGGTARILEKEGRYRYDDADGDPLEIREILDRLRDSGAMGSDGYIDNEKLFRATVDHKYPDALGRIWKAFHGVVENPPDLIATLFDNYTNGNKFFSSFVGNVKSTHGSLNNNNMTTFIMSTARSFPEALRMEDLKREIEEMTGELIDKAGAEKEGRGEY